MDMFSLNTNISGDVAIVTASGRFDSETSPSLDAELTKTASEKNKIVLELKGVDYLSSAGIRAIVKAAQAVEQRGGSVKMASAPELVTSIFYTVGIVDKIKSYSTVDEAIASF